MSDSGCVAETLYHSFDGDTGSELYQYGRGRGVRAVVTLSADAKLVYDEQTSMWNIE